MKTSQNLQPHEVSDLFSILNSRFEKNMHRHEQLIWDHIQHRLEANKTKLPSLHAMEKTGGEPDVTGMNSDTGEIVFVDCSAESPSGRRSLCYDPEALLSRKENKPGGSARGMASEMGIEILTGEQYRQLQLLGPFDTKTSSWLLTPVPIRKAGGAIFGDWRYGEVFVYHNGAESYYAARGFRGMLLV